MARFDLVICALSTVAAVMVLTSGDGRGYAAGWWGRWAVRKLRAACAVVVRLPFVRLLMERASWRAAGEALQAGLVAWELWMSADEAQGMLVLGMLVLASVLCLAARSMLGIFVGIVCCVVGVEIWHDTRRRARERALIDEMPEVFRTLAMALGSGETLMQAIEYVGLHEHGYASQAFVNAALRMRCGVSVEGAMEQLAYELDAPGVELLTTALVIAQRTGSPLRSLFQSSAALVERQGEYDRLLSVKTAQVRLSVRVVCLLPALLVCVLSLISVDFQQGVATVPGTVSLALATCMDAGALLVLRRLMRGVV